MKTIDKVETEQLTEYELAEIYYCLKTMNSTNLDEIMSKLLEKRAI